MLADLATLYLKYQENCGEMLVEENLMDRKLGTKNWDEYVTPLFASYLLGIEQQMLNSSLVVMLADQ